MSEMAQQTSNLKYQIETICEQRSIINNNITEIKSKKIDELTHCAKDKDIEAMILEDKADSLFSSAATISNSDSKPDISSILTKYPTPTGMENLAGKLDEQARSIDMSTFTEAAKYTTTQQTIASKIREISKVRRVEGHNCASQASALKEITLPNLEKQVTYLDNSITVSCLLLVECHHSCSTNYFTTSARY